MSRISQDVIYLDASALTDWLSCRELFRLRWIENLRPKKVSVPMVLGHAAHVGIEAFWRGQSYQDAMRAAVAEMATIDETYLNPYEHERLDEGREGLPDMLACYMDEVEYDDGNLMGVEVEWQIPYPGLDIPVILCGKKDRIEFGPHLYDAKTASAVGKSWLADYKASALRNPQFALYDWHECQMGHPPTMTTLEVITKPYRGTKPKFYRIDLPELAAYRGRFCQQLDWALREIVHYVKNYSAVKPWPMAESKMCVGKFGPCDLLPICLGGTTEPIMKKYTQREEHLELLKIGATQ